VAPRALLSMMKHSLKACVPKPREILGYLSGRGMGNTFLIRDAIPFAVEGTETRVGATTECMTDLIAHKECMTTVCGYEPTCGWYHSHPGLTCYFSEIDVQTHRDEQQMNVVFTGLVIDPIGTMTSGKVRLGGFVTLPRSPEIDSPEATDRIPRAALLKYGNAANKYYELELKYFKTANDTRVLMDIITRSCGQAIACSPLQLNASYIAQTVEEAAGKLGGGDGSVADLEGAAKIIDRVNEARRTGICVERMKRAVFG